MESGFSFQAAQVPVKQFGFTVKESVAVAPHAVRYSSPPPTIKEVSSAEEESGEADAWGLPAHWQAATDANMFCTTAPPSPSLFKGFKDCCEAGSFSLTGFQALQENGRLEVVGTAHTSAGVRSLVKSVVGGLRACQQPEPSAEGLGGTYFFLDELGRRQAIVKPCDEEPLAPNNPKGFVGRALGEPGLKPTVRVGEAAMREVAAFLLDRGRFSHVPYTVLVRVTHNVFHTAPEDRRQQLAPADSAAMSCSQASSSSAFNYDAVDPGLAPPPRRPPSKLASLQEFVQHDSDASEMGCSRFATRDVHRIGILDLRLFNTDRHAGNMLVRRSQPLQGPAAEGPTGWNFGDRLELIPIDHGFCLPEALEPPYLEWLHWPQAGIPFDEEELEYISCLDAAADVEFLTQELPWLPEGSLRTLQVATLLLTRCAAAGLTLGEIGAVASRPLVGLEEEPSQLETACLAARAAVDALDGSASGSEGAEEIEEEGLASSEEGSSASEAFARAESTGLVHGIKMPLQTAVSGDELLFELEDEGASRPPARKLELLPAACEPAQSQDALRPAASSPPGLAMSLATGMLHHRAARPPNARLKRHQRSYKTTPKRRPQAVYPPRVVAAHQSGMNSVFEGLDGRGWALFMEHFEAVLQDALAEGTWKAQPEQSRSARPALGTSCPRF